MRTQEKRRCAPAKRQATAGPGTGDRPAAGQLGIGNQPVPVRGATGWDLPDDHSVHFLFVTRQDAFFDEWRTAHVQRGQDLETVCLGAGDRLSCFFGRATGWPAGLGSGDCLADVFSGGDRLADDLLARDRDQPDSAGDRPAEIFGAGTGWQEAGASRSRVRGPAG